MTEEKKLWQKGGGWLLEVPERVYTPEDFDESVKEIARKTRTGTFAVARVLYRHAKANLVRKRVMPVAV